MPAAAPPPPDALLLAPARFADLPGWPEDAHDAALAAFRRSCSRHLGRAPEFGSTAQWQAICAKAARIPPGRRLAARAFFEATLTPMAASNHGEARGLFTGYYEATLHGSRKRHGRFTVPLYVRPPELVTVDLGEFRDELKGQRIAGRIAGGTLVPYPDRAAIHRGALAGRQLELVWVDDPVDAFFLEIQGSGRVELAEGGVLRLGYAAQNGHPYTAIGRALIARGALAAKDVTLQSIRAWLQSHPAQSAEVLALNRSYVFFAEQPGDHGEGPFGSQGVALTAGRSLAIDTRFLPLGVPVWLDGTAPAVSADRADRPLRRLLVAQDTGGAIRGPVRGDVYWGQGAAAAEIAGRMKHPGRIWVLVPRPRPSPVRGGT